MRTRRIIAAALTAALVMFGALVVAAPAQASIACPFNVVCTYKDAAYEGAMYYYSSPYYQCIPIGGEWNNAISSMINRTATYVRFYNTPDCTDTFNSESLVAYCGCTADRDPNLTAPIWMYFNDSFSSLKIG